MKTISDLPGCMAVATGKEFPPIGGRGNCAAEKRP
jgi:hypothetical protein